MMELFNDFTFYAKYHYENALNIGFNMRNKANAEEVSAQNPDFQKKLIKYAKHRLNLVRDGTNFQMIEVDGTEYALGFGEIRVIAKDGIVYAAPDLVIAWVINGTYSPPKEFQDAVLYGVDSESDSYRQFEKRYKKEFFWGAAVDCLAAAQEISRIMEDRDFLGLKQYLEKNPERINMMTPNGTLLNCAVLLENSEMVEYLLEKGISLSLLSGIELLTAIEKGMTAVVAELLKMKIPVRIDTPRNNPLFWAIAKKRNAEAELLYESNKQLVTTYNIGAIRDCNILQWAKLCENIEFYNYLMKTY